jgi:hypothetical protein
MGCIINKVTLENGEVSQLFKDLSEAMEPAAALENYLELTSSKKYVKIYGVNSQGQVDSQGFLSKPRYKLAEYDSYQQQLDVFDMLTDEFLVALKSEEITSSRSSLTGINLKGLTDNPAILSSILKGVKNNIETEIASNNYPAAKVALMRKGIDNLKGYISVPPTKNSTGRLGPVGLRLANYGIHIKVNTKETLTENLEQLLEEQNGEANYEEIQAEYERIYSMSILDVPPSSSILDQLKIYLRGVKKVARDYSYTEGAAVRYEISEVGGNKPVQFDVLLGQLYKALTGVQSVQEVRDRIAKAVVTNPQLTPIHISLIQETSLPFKGLAGGYNRLSTALFSLAKQNYDMITFVEAVNGAVYVSDANSSTVEKLTAARWEENTLVEQRVPRGKRLAALEKFIENKNIQAEINKKNGGRYVLPSSYFAEAAEHFVNAGFNNVTGVVLKEAVKRVIDNPLLLRKKNINPTPFSVLEALVKALPLKTLNAKRDTQSIFSGDLKTGESKTLSFLSGIVSEKLSDIHIGSYRGGKGTVVHPLNLGSQAQDAITVLTGTTDKSIKYLQDFQGDPMYAKTQVMKILSDENFANDKEVFKLQSLDGLKNNANAIGQGYGDMSSFDALIWRMNSFFSPKSSKNHFHAFSPTQSDRGNLALLTVPKMNLKDSATDGQLNDELFKSDGTLVQGDVKDWVRNQVSSELTRILNSKNILGYKNYSKTESSEGNATRFNLFTSLNATFDSKDLNSRNLEDILNTLVPQAELEFFESVQSDIDYYAESGVLQKNEKYLKLTPEAKNQVGDYHFNGVMKKAEMESFIANNFIYNYEQLLFFTGDPAFYKFGTEAQQKVDINKRMALPFTPGVKLAVGDGTGMPEKFNLKITTEPKQTSEFASFLQEIGGPGIYENSEIADGFGLVSINRYKRTMLAQGKYDDALLTLLTRLEKWKPGDKMPSTTDVEALITSLKAFYFKIHKNSDGIMVPVALKYSIFPAIPSFFEQTVAGKPRFPGLAAISKELRTGKADEVVVPTAVKVGERDVVDMGQLTDAPFMQLDNDAVRHPQPPSDHIKTVDTFGSQMRKLAISNYNTVGEVALTVAGKTKSLVSSQVALDNYNNALSHIVETKGTEAANEFLTDGEADQQKVITKLLSNIDSSTFQSSTYYRSALGTPNENGESLLSLNYPTIRPKLDNMLNSAMRKAVNRLKMPGHSAVQISSFGMVASKAEGEIGVGSDLQFVSFKHLNGDRIDITSELSKSLTKAAKRMNDADKALLAKYEIAPAEIRVSPGFFVGKLKDIAQKRAEGNDEVNDKARAFSNKATGAAKKSSAFKTMKQALVAVESAKELKRLLALITNEDGSYNIKAIKAAGLDEIVLYRIPTQNKNSMMHAVIKEFLPSFSVNTIQVPGEIVDQSGSDFDIDKVYIEMADFTMQGDRFVKNTFIDEAGNIDITSEKRAKAYILEFHKAILSSPQYISELITPNGTKTLKKIVDEFKVGEDAISGNLVSARLQETFRSNNKSGKDLISISSIASVMHAVAPHIGTQFTAPVLIEGKPIVLGKKENFEGELISEEISEIQNAALDNANEPLLGLLNIDSFTASTALLIVSAGLGLKFAAAILDAPAVRYLAKVYPIYSRLNSPEAAKNKALQATRKHFGIKPSSSNTFNLATYNEAQALSLRKGSTVADHALALKAFESIQVHGEALAKFQRVMNSDSKGVPSSAGKLFDVYESMAGIPGTKANRKERTAEGLLADVGRKPNKAYSKIGVNPALYDKSHLSTMEIGTLHKPLVLNKQISPSSSIQMQKVLLFAKDQFGFMDENQQVSLLSAYDTFLATNSKASFESKSSLSDAMAAGEFTYLVDAANIESTGRLLQAYRTKIKDSKGVENQFTEALRVVEDKESGRMYVTFKNTNVASTSAETKDDMIEFFKELMESNVPLERKLAKSLADYAMVNYGYSTSINSFMAFVPPAAHSIYMKGKNTTGVDLASHFRTLEQAFNKPEAFPVKSTEEFLDLYIQNNAHKLKMNTEFVHSNEKGVPKWVNEEREGIENGNPDEPYSPPVYTKVLNESGDVRVFKWAKGKQVPTKMPIMGVPNLISEYHTGASHFVSKQESIVMDSTVEKSNASAENKQVITNIQRQYADFNSVADKAGRVEEVAVYNKQSADRYIASVMAELTPLGLTDGTITMIQSLLDEVTISTERLIRRSKKIGKDPGSYNTIFQQKFRAEIQEVINPYFTPIINKKLC